MPAIPIPARVVRRINIEFDRRHPELFSRLSRIAHRFQDEDEVLAEMTSSAYLNFRSVVLRRGEYLPPSQMAFMAWRRVRSGRTMVGGSVRDVHAPLAQHRGRARLVSLSLLSSSKRQQVLPDSTVQHITDALTASEHERPDVRAAVRLDWAAFARQLPVGLRPRFGLGYQTSAVQPVA